MAAMISFFLFSGNALKQMVTPLGRDKLSRRAARLIVPPV
jgi:hypothetical protein